MVAKGAGRTEDENGSFFDFGKSDGLGDWAALAKRWTSEGMVNGPNLID